MVKALEEANIHPDIIAGVSIGPFNGAIIAGNSGKAAVALERSPQQRRSCRAMALIGGKTPNLSNSDNLLTKISALSGMATKLLIFWCRLQESNPRPTDYKSAVLLFARYLRRERLTFQNATLTTVLTEAAKSPPAAEGRDPISRQIKRMRDHSLD